MTRKSARRIQPRGLESIALGESSLSLETMGYYNGEPHTQYYPFPLSAMYPDTGNFAAFVGNFGSLFAVRRIVESFRRHAKFPSKGTAIPGWIKGVGWSDHWAFWETGYRALMVADTAPFRYPYYHSPLDTPDKIDYDRLARVVDALALVMIEDEAMGNRLAVPEP